MHESPVARELVAEAARQAAIAGYLRVSRMEVRLGPDGGYVPDSLAMHIQAAATGTAAEGAEIEITPVPVGGPELVRIDVEEQA